MLFPTIDFAIFFFILFPLYWAFKSHKIIRKYLLILASYVFYGYWDPRFTLLLFASSFINWTAGYFSRHGKERRKSRIALILGLTSNLSLLFFFKYTDFIIRTFNNIFLRGNWDIYFRPTGIILPVGISFFTFQGISYLMDVYRGDTKVRRNFSDILLYISFFPQLVAGPILRSNVFLPQLEADPDPRSVNIGLSLRKIFAGLFKKIVIANYLASLMADPVFLNPSAYGSPDLLLAAYAYGVQIFCDFSAYSDIAIGVANLLGFHFPENFNKPYSSSSLREFWRRWHISLSSWLRDYLYIPLGGSRYGNVKTARNLFLTMVLGGIWHGAGGNFIVWGIIHGLWLVLERYVFLPPPPQKVRGEIHDFFIRFRGRFITFHIVTLAWIFFRSPDFSSAILYLKGFFIFHRKTSIATPFSLVLIFIGLAIHYIPSAWENKTEEFINKAPVPLAALGSAFLFLVLQIMAPQGVAPFIYFQF